ncbi:MAG: hypothetical protein IPK21_20305 [Haliscomenobacter sp.]|nr:hypothetical protein [Haliscomenobacter sp.]
MMPFQTYYLYGGSFTISRTAWKEQELSTLGLGGEHRIGKQRWIIRSSMLLPRNLARPARSRFGKSPGQAIAISLDTTDREYPRIMFPTPPRR